MALTTQWATVCSTITSSSSSVYTTVAANVASYLRDLVLTNSGTVTVFVGFGSSVTSGSTTSSFAIPTGGTVILTQCQVPNATKIWAQCASGTASVSVGYGTNVAYI